MSVIGEQIKKIRTEKGITQEQLGELIGVTTQAVSRWERGGTPDAELLPRISDVLGVSTDSLFGREEQSYSLALARRLCCMSQEDAFRYALNICWAIEIGLMRDLSIVDDFMGKLIDDSVSADSKRNDYFAKIIHDSGLSLMRISPDFKHFFLMQENGSGIGSHLSDFESLRRVFALFADEKLLRILFYIYSMPNMPIATSLISKNTGLSLSETDRYMKKSARTISPYRPLSLPPREKSTPIPSARRALRYRCSVLPTKSPRRISARSWAATTERAS